jgi:hypothetical protein
MGARRPPPHPDTRRAPGADRPITCASSSRICRRPGAGSGRHHPAYPQGCAIIDPAPPKPSGSGRYGNGVDVINSASIVRRRSSSVFSFVSAGVTTFSVSKGARRPLNKRLNRYGKAGDDRMPNPDCPISQEPPRHARCIGQVAGKGG